MIRRAQRPDTGYTTLSNDPPNDPHLSYGAKGMLWYLLSKPEGWQAKMSILFEASTEKEHATRSIFKELEKAGYVQRTKHFNAETGLVEWDYIVYDSPQPIERHQPAEATAKPVVTATTGERASRPVNAPVVNAPVRSAAPMDTPERRGQAYDFSKGLPDRVVEYLRNPRCRWHWGEDLQTFCQTREMGDPSAYMIGVVSAWIRGDRGRPPDRELPTTTTTKPRDPNAERRKKFLGQT